MPTASSPPRVSFALPSTNITSITKMSVTQTFYLAHKARGKLSSEASRSDHNLRLLVGHANLLDSLMIHLADAEAEQDQWYHNTVRGNEQDSEEYGSLATDYDDSDSDSESESDDEYDDDDYEEEDSLYARARAGRSSMMRQEPVIGVHELAMEDLDEDEDELDEDGMFALTRTTSHRPPSLCSDESDDDDDDATPPSPPQPASHHIPMSAKDLHAASHSYFDSPLDSTPIHGPTPVLVDRRMAPILGDAY